MHKKYNAFQILGKVYKSTFITAPVSAALGILNYVVAGLMPAFAALVLSDLFDTAYKIIGGIPNTEKLILSGVIYLAVFMFNNILEFVASLTINAGVYEKCSDYFDYLLSEKTAKLSLLDFENAEIKNMHTRAKNCVDREKLPQIFMSNAVMITNAISIVTVIGVLAHYSLWFIPVSLFSVLPYFIARVIRGKEFYYVKRQQAKKTRRLEYLWSLFTTKKSVKEMRVMGADDYVSAKWTDCRNEVNEELWLQSKKDTVSLLVCDIIRIVGYALSIAMSLILAMNGTIGIGLFGACIAAFLAVQNASKQFLIDFGNLPERIAFANDYFQFLDLQEEASGGSGYTGLKSVIKVENLSFKYPNCDEYAVDNVSFSINKGEKIAVLGENGSGKTTLSKLILGLYPVTSGQVLYDNENINVYDKAGFLKTVSAIAQNFMAYNMSLRENLAISDISGLSDDRRIEKVLLESDLQNVLNQVGLDGELGREFGGVELSGGQWQKLAIARGLFKDSELMVLDEPTSALDPLIETEILTKFIEIAQDKTAIIISHRVGLCKLVDKIIVMQKGKVVEIGTHNELMKNKGEYHRLFTEQGKWYK